MTKIYLSCVIEAPAERIWQVVRDFNGLPNWHPDIAKSRIEKGLVADKVGCIRNFQTKTGGVIREQLLALSDYDFTCTYSILESPMAVSNYVAILKLSPVTDGNRTFAEWSAEFDCEEEDEIMLSKIIGDEVFKGGLEALKRRFGHA